MVLALPNIELVEKVRGQIYDGKRSERADAFFNARLFVQNLHGYLRELKVAIRDGLIVNIQNEARGEVLGDFIVLGREALNAEQKDVAAVLACAALEDVLKRCASDRGLEVEDKDMSDVVNALKSEGVIRGPQGRVLSGYVQIRNKTFQEWDA